MPEAFALEFMLTYIQLNDIASWIRKLIVNLESDPDQECRKKLTQICKREAKTSYMRRCEWFTACVIDACTALKDDQLLLEVIEGCSALRAGSDVHRAMAKALDVIAFRDVQPR